MNNIWEKFGCNDYDLVVLEIDPWETGDVLIKAYQQKGLTLKYPLVDNKNGAAALVNILNCGQSGRVIMIKPNKTFRDLSYDEKPMTAEIKSNGVKEHACGTCIESDRPASTSPDISLLSIRGNSIHLKIGKRGMYLITLYSMDGAMVYSVQKMFETGAISLPFPRSGNGMRAGICTIRGPNYVRTVKCMMIQ